MNIRDKFGVDIDSDEAMAKQKEVFKNKKCLYQNYLDTYNMMVKLGDKYLAKSDATEIELGSGGGFFKEVNPKVITSDVTAVNGVDMVIDAQQLPFENGALSRIYAMHVIHHIPNIRLFLAEAVRTLKPGTGMVIVEPYGSPVGKFFYKRFHSEPFDENALSWDFEETGNMSSANQALSYIVFKRDKEIFEKEFPELEVVYDRPFNGVRYLATGGLWLRQYLPGFCFPILAGIEKILWPLMYFFGIHHVMVIRRK